MSDEKKSEYLDLATLAANAETSGEPVETEDYTPESLVPVGSYLSAQRTIKGVQKPDKTFTFEITLTGGVTDENTGITYGTGQYPFRTWISTKLFKFPDRVGMTSTAAEYLRKCHIDPKSVGGDIINAVMSTMDIPVKVNFTWEEKVERAADGSYPKTKLKAKDFNVGTKTEPKYVPTVTINGVTYEARSRISGFAAVRG